MKIEPAIRSMMKRVIARYRDGSPATMVRVPEYVLPPILAFLAVWEEPVLTQLSRTHEAMLPLATMLLLATLLHPRLRHYLVVTLCYGVAFLAIHDAQRVAQVPLPAALNYDWVDLMRPVGLWLVAALAAVSGIAESISPGRVWVRRFYFAAATLYFTGLGVMGYAWTHSWQSVLLCITGLTALGGCVMAHRIVAAESQEDEELPNDESAQQARDRMHRNALQSKEWQDNLFSRIEECDPVTGPAPIDASHPA